jgi:hypothetical protein
MADREGDELYASLVFSEGREEGSVLLGIGLEFGLAAKITTESDSFDDDERAVHLVEGGRVQGG